MALGEDNKVCPGCGNTRMVARPSAPATASGLGKMAVIASALGLAACGANEEREPDAVVDVQEDAPPIDVEQDIAQDTELDSDGPIAVDVYGAPPLDVQEDTPSPDAEPDIQVEPAYGIPPEDVREEPDVPEEDITELDAEPIPGDVYGLPAEDAFDDADSDVDLPTPEYGIPPEP
jgi:hypothetical protein